jgi:hypothetical protein
MGAKKRGKLPPNRQGKALAPTRKTGRPDIFVDRGRELVQQGISALDVMADNMLFWHRNVHDLTSRLSNTVLNIEDPDERKTAYNLIKLLLQARENSQRCAVDLAPYIHAKLQSIQMSTEVDKTVTLTMNIMAAASEDEDRSYRDGYDNDTKIVALTKKSA